MYLNRTTYNQATESRRYHFRLSLLVAFLMVFTCILVLRLAWLQFSQYKRYATLSLKNQMSITPLVPPRGVILDRNGIILADNIPVYVLEIVPERIKNLQSTLEQLQTLLPSITEEDIEQFEHTRRRSRSYASVPIKLKLTQEEVAIFASNQYKFPGVAIKARLMRHYPLAEKAAHALGYVGRINTTELQQVDSTNYRATNFIGKVGVERYYEEQLHGTVGYQQAETDVSGRTLRVLSKQPPTSGERLSLSLDARLQEAAFEALQGKRGAVVMIDVSNGEVLAMSSAPSFNPNLFVNGIPSKEYQQLANAPDRPLYNRAVRGLYPPASTVKPFLAIAGLDKGYVTPDTRIYDPGWYQLPGIKHQYRDWKRSGHGIVNVKRAIAVSCDTYFYQLGTKMGISIIEDTLMQFGMGQLSHVDLYEETSGLVPNPSWKKRNKGANWYPGDTVITAIGQGFTLATPLQLANATASLSQHGRRFRPHLLQKSVQDSGETQYFKALEEYPIQLKNPIHWTTVADAMHSVITSNEGTGLRFGRKVPYPVAGKTGTAQVFHASVYEKKQYNDIPEALRDHTLFIAFAPVTKPEVALAVVVENDLAASFVARKMLDTYFELQSTSTPVLQPTKITG